MAGTTFTYDGQPAIIVATYYAGHADENTHARACYLNADGQPEGVSFDVRLASPRVKF